LEGKLERMASAKAPSRYILALCAIVLAVFVWSFIGCHDVFTWSLEVAPGVIGLAVLVAIYRRFQFTDLVYTFIAAHVIILFIGGHYTYAEMPLFNWIRDHYHLSRNYYDRLGHFAQGFVPALIAREVLLRKTALRRGPILTFLVLCICMAISAWYELFEFAVAKLTGTAADAFLGAQGDPWDTQWDMTFCFIGASCALLFMTRLHDRFLARLQDGELKVSRAAAS
jgi:putative membrane protein